MTNNFVLCVDIDDTAGKYGKALRQNIAQRNGIANEDQDRLLPLDYSWDYPEWYPFVRDREHYLEHHHRAVLEDDILLTLEPMDQVAEVLWRLNELGVWIRIVTHRLLLKNNHGKVGHHTLRWLDEHNIPYRDLVFTGSKAEVGGDLFIDDAPHNIAALRAARKDVIIFDQPYNRHITGLRAVNWLEVEDIVRTRMGERGLL